MVLSKNDSKKAKGKRKQKKNEQRIHVQWYLFTVTHCSRRLWCLTYRRSACLHQSIDRRCISSLVTFSHSHPSLPVEPLGIWLWFPQDVLPSVNLTSPIITSEFSFWHFPPTSSFHSSANAQQPNCLLKPTANAQKALCTQQRTPPGSHSLFQGRTTARPRV